MHGYDFMLAPLISLLCIAIGLIVYLNNRKDSSGKAVAIISISLGFWILSAFLSDVTKNEFYSLLLNRVIFVALFFFMGGLLYLPFVFPARKKYANYIKYFLIIFLEAIFFVTCAWWLIKSRMDIIMRKEFYGKNGKRCFS